MIIFLLHICRHAKGRTCHGMDHYATKAKNASVPSTQAAQVADTYQSPSPTLNAPGESGLQFPFEEETKERNLDMVQRKYHWYVSPINTTNTVLQK